MRICKVVILFFVFLQVGISQSKFNNRSKNLPDYQPNQTQESYKSFLGELDNYIRSKIGIKDSVASSNNVEGESYHSSITYKLKHGHKYVISSEWEGFNTSVRFKNVSFNEVYKLTKSILESLDGITSEQILALKDDEMKDFALEDLCCFIGKRKDGRDTWISVTNNN